MELSIQYYSNDDLNSWEALCYVSLQSTFLHTRKFLSYHKDRFCDRSLVIHANGVLVGVLPCAVSLTDSQTLVSHPGATYGGVILHPKFQTELVAELMQKIADFYFQDGYKNLIYKAVPFFYQRRYRQDDIHALFNLGAKKLRSDLTSLINLNQENPISSRRLRGLKKANSNNLSLNEGTEYLSNVWDILKENLSRKYSTQPVHSLDEISQLCQLFPENIKVFSCEKDRSLQAGVVGFETDNVFHCQYITSTGEGNLSGALDFLFFHLIDRARSHNKNWFNFGISTYNEGKSLNNGLYEFKAGFGAGGVSQDWFVVNLSEVASNA